MKQITNKNDFDTYPLLNRLFFVLWLQKKGYEVKKEISFSQWLELGLALGVRYDSTIRSGDDQTAYFNNVLDLGEFLVAFDGPEPIDTISYKINESLRKRILHYLSKEVQIIE